MRVAVVGAEGGGLLQAVAEDGTPQGPPEPVPDLAAAVAEREQAGRPRWVWAATAELYPGLLQAGARADRCHDLGLTEGILLAADGRWASPGRRGPGPAERFRCRTTGRPGSGEAGRRRFDHDLPSCRPAS